METLLLLCVGGAFVTGWVLGYYDIPNLKLSAKDYEDDRDESDALRQYRKHPEKPQE